jgi:DNA-binding MarR family transcriptional regulator
VGLETSSFIIHHGQAAAKATPRRLILAHPPGKNYPVSLDFLILSMESIKRMKTAMPSGLESHLGYWLRRVSNHVSLQFSRALAEQNVSVAEWVAVRRLYDQPGLSPRELALALGMTQGAISKIIDKLLAKRWIAARDNQADRRQQFLTLTAAGRKAVPQLARIADENDAQFFGELSGKEQAKLRRLMERLTEIHHWDDTPTT